MRTLPLASSDHESHVSFVLIAPYLRAALLLGCGGGFALATVLTLAPLFGIPLSTWWAATVQTHGHLQLFGWAGLFVVGVALYFLPRLRGIPLARPELLPWILGIYVLGLVLRFLSQPLLAITGWFFWKSALLGSGVLEALVLPAILLLLLQTALKGPTKKSKVEGVSSIAPFILGAFLGLALAGILNLFNCIAAFSGRGIIPAAGDEADITLGLFGFLVPVALAMSTRMLPLYVNIQPFPTRLLRILALLYFGGVVIWLLSLLLAGRCIYIF